MTVNCLSQYSGCKCILAFTKKTIITSQANLHVFLLIWINKTRGWNDRHITNGTLMINWMCLSNDFISLLQIWNLGTMWNWCLFLVCVVVLQMSTVILCEKVPRQCTAWIWCIMCPIHCELMGKKKNQPLNFDFSSFDLFGFFFSLSFFLLMLTCPCCSMLAW